MRPKTFTVTGSAGGVSTSPVYVVDTWNETCSIALAVTVSGPLAVADVQHTLADPFAVNLNSAVSGVAAWVNHDTIASATAANSQDGTVISNYAHPPRAIRLRVRALASAGAGEKATLTIQQTGPN